MIFSATDEGFAIKAKVLFADLPIEQMRVLPKRRRLWGDWVYVAALRLKDGQLLVVTTSDSPETAIADYAKRWEIETLFGCLKRRGSCLESTYLSDAARLSKLKRRVDVSVMLGLPHRRLVSTTQALENY